MARTIAVQNWARIDPDGDWLTQWRSLLVRVVLATMAAQSAAARVAEAASVEALRRQGWTGEQRFRLQPLSLAGWMEPDGSPFQVPLSSSLLTAPVVAARTATGTVPQRLASGASMLDSLVQAAVSHSGRMAVQVAAHGRTGTQLAFYEPGGACQRCAVLVGKTAGMHENFKRHPRCDGVVVEVPQGAPVPFEPLDVNQVKDLTLDQRQAVEDGADLYQIINARSAVRGREQRSVLSSDGLTTSAGARRGQTRLTPRGIYAAADGDREKALELLRRYGYLR